MNATGSTALLPAPYRVERQLGRGAAATVYLAEDVKHRRHVAVKVFRREISLALGSARFLREIEIVASLNHPHILPLYDSGDADGVLYYVMPYVADGSLRDRLLRETQLPIGVAVRITREVADALHYAHQHDVIHRDIKPANILLEEGHAVVSDFGIALNMDDREQRLTSGSYVIGTPEYMSPEQASADPTLDGRSDQYSLACVLYEMLAGHVPFVGANARAVIARQIADPAPPVNTVRPELRHGLVRTVHRALAKVPADRFPDMPTFADALADPGAVETAPTRSIAVLPFAYLGGRPEDAYLGDGISEEIINALLTVGGLHVASRTSTFALRGASRDIRGIGDALGVRTVLEGSVQVAGPRLRVTTRLVRVTDGQTIWTERFDRELQDVLRIQDEIAERVVQSLRVVLSQDERRAIRRGRTDDPQAYAAYLRGRQFFFHLRRKSLEHARRLFRQAIALDSEYARAHAGIADCASFLHMYFGASDEDLGEAEAASGRALELEPDLAEAHASRGLAVSLRGRYDEAVREFETAVQLNPNLFEARYFHARAAYHEGRLEEALQLFDEACQVREDYQARLLWAQCYAALGRDAEAVEAYQRARRTIEDHLELNPGDTRALMLGGAALARLGDAAKATAWAERTLAIDPDDAVVLYGVACVYSLLGRSDRALDLLGHAVRAGFRKREWIEHDPDLDSVRGDPRYRAIMESCQPPQRATSADSARARESP